MLLVSMSEIASKQSHSKIKSLYPKARQISKPSSIARSSTRRASLPISKWLKLKIHLSVWSRIAPPTPRQDEPSRKLPLTLSFQDAWRGRFPTGHQASSIKVDVSEREVSGAFIMEAMNHVNNIVELPRVGLKDNVVTPTRQHQPIHKQTIKRIGKEH